mmetsp:Transcript_48034/g.126850  ORF Transcript_48034/g.126850 Transcript_48034/m.126850 type:complete len:275 (-) Transcript_48034:798-1622(-)
MRPRTPAGDLLSLVAVAAAADDHVVLYEGLDGRLRIGLQVLAALGLRLLGGVRRDLPRQVIRCPDVHAGDGGRGRLIVGHAGVGVAAVGLGGGLGGLRRNVENRAGIQVRRRLTCQLLLARQLLLLLELQLELVLDVGVAGDEHTQEETEEEGLPEEDQAAEDKGCGDRFKLASCRTHCSVHDCVPVLASHDLEDCHEAPGEGVKVGARYALLPVVPGQVFRTWTPRDVFAIFDYAVPLGEGAGRRFGLLEVELVAVEGHHHQREDVEHQQEQN